MPHIRPQWLVDHSFELTDRGVTDRENAQACGVTIRTIRRWRRLYRRRGLPRGQPRSSVPCPRCDEGKLDDAGYAHLLGWYLGDGHLAKHRRGVYALTVVNDAAYPGLGEEISAAMARVKTGCPPFQVSATGCVIYKLTWKHWPCLFPQHGPGPKHQRPIVLEPWQREIVERHPGRFLRGLFHSDGCRITNWTVRPVGGVPRRYEYPRYLFSNRSPDVIALCCWALDLLGIAWRMPKPIHVSVARRDAVAALDTHVGPKS